MIVLPLISLRKSIIILYDFHFEMTGIFHFEMTRIQKPKRALSNDFHFEMMAPTFPIKNGSPPAKPPKRQTEGGYTRIFYFRQEKIAYALQSYESVAEIKADACEFITKKRFRNPDDCVEIRKIIFVQKNSGL